MAKGRASFVCQNCGAVAQRWQGKCESCGEWNSMVEEAPSSGIAARAVAGAGALVRPTRGGFASSASDGSRPTPMSCETACAFSSAASATSGRTTRLPNLFFRS
jgi:DNA repair protein RadA/Sms